MYILYHLEAAVVAEAGPHPQEFSVAERASVALPPLHPSTQSIQLFVIFFFPFFDSANSCGL